MRIDKFQGLNNQQAPTEFGLAGMVLAQNVDITDAFKLRLRNGKGAKLSTVAISAASSTGEGEVLYQVGNTLYLMNNAGTHTVQAGLDNARKLHCTKVNDLIFWSNGVQRGYIRGQTSKEFINNPVNNGTIAQFNGLMPSGTYLYALTYTDYDGIESGSMQASVLEVSSGGIDITYPPSTQAKYVNLYLTHANGEVLYHAVTNLYADGGHIMYAGDTVELITPIKNQFCEPPIAWTVAGFYKGRMYYAKDGDLYASKPFNFNLIDYATDFVRLFGQIRLVMPAESGIFVATDREIHFLSGSSPSDFVTTKVLDYGAIEGTAQRVFASTINPNQAGNVWLFATNRGLVAAFDGGSVTNLTDKTFAFPDTLDGTASLREENGLRQLLITCHEPNTVTPVVVVPPDPSEIPTFTITSNSPVIEGNNAIFTVTFSHAFNDQLDWDFSIERNGAVLSDIGAMILSNDVLDNGDGTLSVPSETSSFIVTIPIINDGISDPGESITFMLGDVTHVLLIIEA